jgi:MerR family transcriptional regulator, mercuric resistance operon regulatory protein
MRGHSKGVAREGGLKVKTLDLKVECKVEGSDMKSLLIGDVARKAGVSTATIRYYERIGVLPSPPRAESNYRRYTRRTIEELRFVRKGQALGFNLTDIASLLKLSRSGTEPCLEVLSLAERQLHEVDERIRLLTAFRASLAETLTRWRQSGCGSTAGLCELFEEVELPAGAAVSLDETTKSFERLVVGTHHDR